MKHLAFRSNPVYVRDLSAFLDWVALIQAVTPLEVRISNLGVYLCGEGELPHDRALSPEERAAHHPATTLGETSRQLDFLGECCTHLSPGEHLTVQGGGYEAEYGGVTTVYGWTVTLNAQGETLHAFDLSDYDDHLPPGEDPRTHPYRVEGQP